MQDPTPQETHVRRILGRYHGRWHELDLANQETRTQLALDVGYLTGLSLQLLRGPRLGPTGDYPDGRLDASDEGGLQIAITTYKGKVVLAFGGPVAWVGLGPELARDVASTLQARALSAEAEREGPRGPDATTN
jgi:hypothetical protein